MEEWKSQIKKYVFSIDSTEKDIEQGFDLKYKHVPNSLFKYYRFSERSFNYLKLNLASFSSPIDFNDPFDCNLSISDKYTDYYLEDLIKNRLTLEDSRKEELLMSNDISGDFFKGNYKFNIEQYKGYFQIIIDGFSVYCF